MNSFMVDIDKPLHDGIANKTCMFGLLVMLSFKAIFSYFDKFCITLL